MNKLAIEALEVEKTKIVVSEIPDHTEESSVLISISGEIDMRDPAKSILPYLIRIHEAAITRDIKIIDIDVRELSYVNSSGIKTIISWLMLSKNIADNKRYHVRIIQNSDIPWQESTFPVIQKLFPELITFSHE